MGAWTVRELDLADAAACDDVIETLPYFFGQAAGIAECAAAVRSQRGLVAVDSAGQIVAFLTYASHHPTSAEITWMAVRQDRRRRVVGRRLLEELDDKLSGAGVHLLFVITLGPSVQEPGVSDGYAGTRRFYEAVSFVPLKELDAWGPDSSGIIVVRVTKGGRAA